MTFISGVKVEYVDNDPLSEGDPNMPRRIIKKYMPDPKKLQQQKSLRFLGKLLDDPGLLHLTRRSVANA
ncbi:hypothetical protein ABMA58_08885, partial [Oceanospirillum sp. HFRX-1_2]